MATRTRRVVAGLLLIIAAGAAPGQPPGGPPPSVASPPTNASTPDPGGVVAAYLRLAEWVATFDLPDPDAAEARLAIPEAEGVCVIVRRRGRVLGTAVDCAGDDLMVRRAAARALSQVLGDRAVAALPPDARTRIGRGLTVELEVAGRFVALPGRSYQQIVEQLDPGLDGIAMRRDAALETRFPAQQRASGTAGALARALPGLAVELGLPARDLKTLRERFGVRLYGFRTIHLTQRAPGRRPFATTRGQQLVTGEAVTTARLISLAEDLLNHVVTALWPGDEPLGLMGDYRPVSDQYTPLVAAPRDQALVAFALGRCAGVEDLRADTRRRLRETVEVIMRDLATVAGSERDPVGEPTACGAIVLAVCEMPDTRNDPRVDELFGAAVTRLQETFDPGAGLAPGETTRAGDLTRHEQGLLAAALARLLRTTPELVDRDRARAAIDLAWGDAAGPAPIAALPWIGWAELDYAAATDAPLARVEDLRLLRDLLEANRIGGPDRPGAADLRGGFALTAGPRPLADARSLGPAAFLATMLRHPSLTTAEERTAVLRRHRSTLRFLLQLAVDDTLLWAFRQPQRAQGGIRAAPWDNTQPTAAQALGLLLVAETLTSTRAVGQVEGPTEGPVGDK